MNWQTRSGACVLLAASVLAGPVAHAQADTVTIKRATELRETPGETSRSLAPLAVQTPVTRVGPRQGPWIEVRTAQGSNGWVHMFDVGSNLPVQGGNTATGALRGLTSFFGRSSAAPAPTTATATIGIRGLGAEDIANAQPDLEAVTRAEGMRQDASQARQFGAAAQLAALVVEPLPVPAAATRTPGATSGAPAAMQGGSQR